MARTTSQTGPDYLSVGSTLITVAPFTFLLWARTTDTDDFQELGFMSQAGTDNFWKLRLRMGSSKVEFQAEQTMPGDQGEAEVLALPTINEWAHYAFLEAASNDRSGFLDAGNKTSNATDIAPKSIDTMSLGQLDDGSPAGRFIGDLGHAALYDIALTDQEIESVAVGHVSPLRMHRNSLVGLWPLNGRSPEYNVMGTGTDLTLFGSPAIADEPPIPNFLIAPG